MTPRTKADVKQTADVMLHAIDGAKRELEEAEQRIRGAMRLMKAGRAQPLFVDEVLAQEAMSLSLPNSLRILAEGLENNRPGLQYEDRQPGEEG